VYLNVKIFLKITLKNNSAALKDWLQSTFHLNI